jgi:hypothetical protein
MIENGHGRARSINLAKVDRAYHKLLVYAARLRNVRAEWSEHATVARIITRSSPECAIAAR